MPRDKEKMLKQQLGRRLDNSWKATESAKDSYRHWR